MLLVLSTRSCTGWGCGGVQAGLERRPHPLTRSLASAPQFGPCGSSAPVRRITIGPGRLHCSLASQLCESQKGAIVRCGWAWGGGSALGLSVAAFRGSGKRKRFTLPRHWVLGVLLSP